MLSQTSTQQRPGDDEEGGGGIHPLNPVELSVVVVVAEGVIVVAAAVGVVVAPVPMAHLEVCKEQGDDDGNDTDDGDEHSTSATDLVREKSPSPCTLHRFVSRKVSFWLERRCS